MGTTNESERRINEGVRGNVCGTRVKPGSIFRGLAVAQSHPNPRRSVRPSGMDRAWELPSEHKRQIVVSRSPFIPPSPIPAPPPSPVPPSKNIVFYPPSPHRNSWLAPRYDYYSTSKHNLSLMSSPFASKPPASPPEMGNSLENYLKK